MLEKEVFFKTSPRFPSYVSKQQLAVNNVTEQHGIVGICQQAGCTPGSCGLGVYDTYYACLYACVLLTSLLVVLLSLLVLHEYRDLPISAAAVFLLVPHAAAYAVGMILDTTDGIVVCCYGGNIPFKTLN